MTIGRRIALNTIATYGRSMFGVLCGIFSTRWVLEALGQESFGLYGVVGSMAIFVSFLNIQLASAIGRFYAFSVGMAQRDDGDVNGLEECRSWFSTGVFVHTLFPVILVAIGYPMGVSAMRTGMLAIPSERLVDCLWLWRIVCLMTFISMVNVPFQAMYVAKQYIAELTIYSLAQTIVRTILIYYMVLHPGEWLVRYGWIMCATAVIPQLLISFRALWVFQECRFRFRESICLRRICQLGNFAFWQSFGGLGFLASHQAMSILINNWYGATVVGSFSISQTVSGEAASLTGALQGAFTPAITTAYGAGNIELMRSMAFRVCKVGTLLTLMFGLPMALEIDELLLLWLKSPPPGAAAMCLSTIAFIVIEKMTCGHLAAVNASGHVAAFQAIRGLLRMTVIPLALVIFLCGFPASVVVIALPVSAIIVDLGDVLIASSRVGMGCRYWIMRIVLPIVCVAGCSYAAGFIVRSIMSMSVARLVVSTIITLVVFGLTSWRMACDVKERQVIISKIHCFLWRK